MRAFLLLALLLVGCGRPPVPLGAAPVAAAPVPRAWTVMIYFPSDNDLEASQLVDLEEMARAGSTEAVQVVTLVDRSPDDDLQQEGCSNEALLNLPDWHGAKLLAVEKGRFRELEDWGAVNTADPEVLSRFVAACRERYPARRQALIIGDHGMGWAGACVDDSGGAEELLTLPEMARALQGADLELLGFDACFMATLEVARALAPCARILVSSQDIEPGRGWAYGAVLQALASQPEMDGPALGKVVADTYQASFPADDEEGLALTLSVVDLGQVGAIGQALERLAVRLEESLSREGRSAWVGAARARSRAEEYGASDDFEPGSALHDVVDLADQLAREMPRLRPEANALREATRSAVLHSIRGPARPEANGLSLFFPTGPGEDDPEYALIPGLSRGWLGFLGAYGRLSASDLKAPTVHELRVAPEVLGAGESLLLTGSVAGEDVEACSFVLVQNEEDGQTIVGSLPVEPGPGGRLQRAWDGRWFALGDQEGFLTISVTGVQENEDGSYLATCPAQWQRKKQSGWKDVTLTLYVEPGGELGELVYVTLDEDDEPTREIELEPGNRVRAVYRELDEEGDEVLVPDENEECVLLVDEEGLFIEMLEVDPGHYSVGFVATDFSGNRGEMLTDVEVEE